MHTKPSRTRAPYLVAAALVVGLGGTATAAATITGAQIKNGTVTTKDVKDGTLTVRDLAPGTVSGAGGAPGPQGPAGPAGERGPTGPQGPEGAPASEVEVPVLRAEGVAPNCLDVVQSIPNDGGGVKLFWRREVFDNADMLSPTCALQSDLIAPRTGAYLITASIEWPAAEDNGRRTLGIKEFGGQFLAADSRTNVLGGPAQQSISTVQRLTQGSAIQIWAFHTAPSGLPVNAALSTTNVTMSWLSP